MTKPPNLSEASDHDLLARAREGDEDACREFVRRYGPTVFDTVYRMVGNHELAEDLTQETFLKAFRALDRHGPEQTVCLASPHREQHGARLRAAQAARLDALGPHDYPPSSIRIGTRCRRPRRSAGCLN